MNYSIAGHWLPGHFVRLKLGSDVPEHIAPLRRWSYSVSTIKNGDFEDDIIYYLNLSIIDKKFVMAASEKITVFSWTRR